MFSSSKRNIGTVQSFAFWVYPMERLVTYKRDLKIPKNVNLILIA